MTNEEPVKKTRKHSLVKQAASMEIVVERNDKSVDEIAAQINADGHNIPMPPVEKLERIDITQKDVYPEDMIKRHIDRYQWAVDRIKNRFGTAKVVLDYGCGTGYGSRMILSVAKAVVGVDASLEAIRRAVRVCNSGLAHFQTGSEANFPPARVANFSYYDAIVAIEVIEHIDNPEIFLKRAFKLTRKNGLLLITTPVRPAGKDIDWVPDNIYHKREYDISEFENLVSDCGWSISRTVDLKKAPGFMLLEAGGAK